MPGIVLCRLCHPAGPVHKERPGAAVHADVPVLLLGHQLCVHADAVLQDRGVDVFGGTGNFHRWHHDAGHSAVLPLHPRLQVSCRPLMRPKTRISSLPDRRCRMMSCVCMYSTSF